jgi:hypothetical protein
MTIVISMMQQRIAIMKKILICLSLASLAMAALPAAAQTSTETTTVVTKKPSAGAGVGVVGGAATGAMVGGPVGAVIGGVVGAVAGAAVDPPADVKTYVRTQHVDPVTYDGEITVGRALPETVTVYDVPKYERYRWTYVNGQRVLIDQKTRNVVAIIADQ